MTSFDFHPPAAHAAVEWALAYARVAMAVFPCGADSRPLVERGFKNATTNPGQIRAWWKRWPHAEIGWAVPGGVVVVDLDVKKGKRGLEDFFRRECIEPDSVETPLAVTPSGGRHLVFDDCGRAYSNVAEVIKGTGIDLRVGGLGYIVLARKDNGRWWLKPLSTPVAPAPSWLPVKPPERPSGEARPYTGQATPGALDALKDACAEIKAARPGGRNAAINCASYHIGRRVGAGHLDEAQAIGALVDAVEHMQHPSENLGRDIGKVECAIAAGRAKPWEERGPTEERPFSFNTVLGLAKAVATAPPEKRVALTTWASRRMAGNIVAGNINRDLAHRVLFEAAMRNGLPALEAGSIIENALRSNPGE